MLAAIRRASSFASKFAACITFHIGTARSYHPVSSNRVGIHQDRYHPSQDPSHHASQDPSCCSSHLASGTLWGRCICRADIFHPVPSNRVGIVEHRQA
jgi:hypothetical protein